MHGNSRESGLEHVQRGLNLLKHARSVSSRFSAARPRARCTKSTRNLEPMKKSHLQQDGASMKHLLKHL